MTKYIIPLEGDGTQTNPFRPKYIGSVPAIVYDVTTMTAILDPYEAKKKIQSLPIPDKQKKMFLEMIDKAVEKLEQIIAEKKKKGEQVDIIKK